jgi:hypothetical protein
MDPLASESNQQTPLPSLPLVNPFVRMQQPQRMNSANNMHCQWPGGFYGPPSSTTGLPSYTGPSSYIGAVYQGMAPNQHTGPQNQYQPPNRNRRKQRSRKAEYPHHYTNIHEPSGTVFYDHSTGVYPGMARIDASNDPGIGMVWRTSSKNPLMADMQLSLALQQILKLRCKLFCRHNGRE